MPRGSPKGDTHRAVIMDIVRSRPGIHKSELRRLMGLSWGSISHHLAVLRASNEISAMRVGRICHLIPAGDCGARGSREPLDDASMQVFQALNELGTAGPKQVSKQAGLTTGQVRRCLRTLLEKELIGTDHFYHPRYWPIKKTRPVLSRPGITILEIHDEVPENAPRLPSAFTEMEHHGHW